MGTEIELIVGLGNPGPEHLLDRHNAGFWFADLLARTHEATFRKDKKLHGETAEVVIAGHRIRLLKPMTYMNLSGRAVGAAVSYYKVPLDRVLVAYDELDFPPGRVQLKFDGSAAGHRGVTNIIATVGSGFWRLRFGVGHPGHGRRREVLDHVLARASATEEELIMEAIQDAVRALPTLLERGAERAKTELHSRKRPAVAEDP